MSGPENESLLFEVSWEACRKVGGIYTVLRSKAPTVVARWADRYCLIGPYIPETAAVEFDPLEPGEVLGPTLRALRERGMPVHFGRWLINGSPRVILLDYSRMFHAINDWKRQLWEACKIGIPNGDSECDEAVVFASMVTEFFQELVHQTKGNQKMIAQFHEWMASLALPLIRHRQLPVATVFTTHATLLGRYMCASDVDFYSRLHHMDPDHEAGRLNMHHRFAVERAAAHSSHVFTTVSEVTADESEKILGRRPDVVLPNGLEVKKFAALHEFQNLHRQYKEQIHEFVRGHFFGSYSFDLDKTLYMFIAGRYEYRNKGIDLFIESLHRLNHRLQQVGSDVTVVAFLVAPAATRSVHVEVLKNRFMLAELRKTCERLEQDLGERIYQAAAGGDLPDIETLMTESDIVRLKRMIYSRRHTGLPPVVTHDMVDDNRDPILNHLRHRGLFNSPNDRVKVVYHPEFIVSTNPLFGIDYEEFVRGCHLGVFPSYYEPWGYTPAECTVMGVPSVCTNLSGFGVYMQEKVERHEHCGIYVVDRRYVGADDSINQLSDMLYRFSQLGRRERIAMRNRTERLSDILDWGCLYPAYTQAHDLALHRMWP